MRIRLCRVQSRASDVGTLRGHEADVVRHDEWAPSRALDRTVTAFWQMVGDASKMPRARVMPDGQVELVLDFGGAIAPVGAPVAGGRPRTILVGLQSTSFELDCRGPIDLFGIRLHPARGSGIFGLRAPALVGKILPLRHVCPALDASLEKLVAERPPLESAEWRGRLEALFVEQRQHALPVDAAIVRAVDRLIGAAEMPSVERLADEVALSPRQFNRRFIAAVGISPKRFVRIIRFSRVCEIATAQPASTWASLAAAHGYFDQAHLAREFRAFGALPPTRFFNSERRPRRPPRTESLRWT